MCLRKEKKKIFNEFVDSRLGIPLENIQGRTLEAKIDSLITYYANDINETADIISRDGYEQLINILKNCDKLNNRYDLPEVKSARTDKFDAGHVLSISGYHKLLLFFCRSCFWKKSFSIQNTKNTP